MKKLILVLMAAAGIFSTESMVQAGGHANPFNGPPSNSLVFPLFRKQSLPAFQAAPWYLYWPYNGHFQTPAPLYGPSYGPPGMGGYGYGAGANPYFQQVAPPAPAQPGK